MSRGGIEDVRCPVLFPHLLHMRLIVMLSCDDIEVVVLV